MRNVYTLLGQRRHLFVRRTYVSFPAYGLSILTTVMRNGLVSCTECRILCESRTRDYSETGSKQNSIGRAS